MSQRKVSLEAGISPSSLNGYLAGRDLPKNRAAVGLGRVLSLNPRFLMGESSEQEPERTPSAPSRVEHLRSLVKAQMPDEQIAIPKLLRVAAGTAVYSPADDARAVLVGRKSIEALVGPIPAVKPESVVFAAEVKGDSMAPSLLEGDTLIVKRFMPRTRGPLIENGRVYLLTPDNSGDAQVKRLLLVDGHQLLVVSDNQKFPPKAVDLRNAERVQHMIIGQAVRLIRNL